MTDPRKLAEEFVAFAAASEIVMADKLAVCARELLAALDREAALQREDEAIGWRDRAEAAEARADTLEEALREVADCAGSYSHTEPVDIARDALAAHGKGDK